MQTYGNIEQLNVRSFVMYHLNEFNVTFILFNIVGKIELFLFLLTAFNTAYQPMQKTQRTIRQCR